MFKWRQDGLNTLFLFSEQKQPECPYFPPQTLAIQGKILTENAKDKLRFWTSSGVFKNQQIAKYVLTKWTQYHAKHEEQGKGVGAHNKFIKCCRNDPSRTRIFANVQPN